MLLGGVVVDRHGARRVAIISDAGRGAVMVAAVVALATRPPDLPLLLTISVLFGIGDALAEPAIGALPPRLAPPERLLELQSLRGAALRMALVIGAPLGGLLVVRWHASGAFAFNALTFVVALVAMTTIRLRTPDVTTRAPGGTNVWRDLRDGLRDVHRRPGMMPALVVVFLVELGLAGTLEIALPLLARTRHWSGSALGFAVGAFGLGSGIAAVGLSRARRRDASIGAVVGASGAAAAVSVGAAALLPTRAAALGAMFAAGAAAGVLSIELLAFVQTASAPAVLGRTMSCFALATSGSLPFASELTGAIGGTAGPGAAMLVDAALILGASAIGWRALRLRRAAPSDTAVA
ncbi:MAG: hypothetical protein JWN46_1332 [Acidimicrobiales bacterium]|nr:hypothetical protein [Acidimicrobiales bacterium]